MSERLELPDNGYVILESRLTYARRRRVVEARDGGNTAVAEALCLAMITGGAMLGASFPKTIPVDGLPDGFLDAVPADIVDVIVDRVAELFAAPAPNDTSATSPESPRASSPKSRRTSQMPTSSPTIRDGHGAISRPPLPM